MLEGKPARGSAMNAPVFGHIGVYLKKMCVLLVSCLLPGSLLSVKDTASFMETNTCYAVAPIPP